MFQTAGYPAPPPGGPNGHYPGPPGVGGNPNANANAAMMMRGNGAGGPPQGMGPPHSQGQGGFNPNMPSSSRAK
uniref:LID domain-containing protein n=1 Tax=Panagrellus redivivus TaxID=6233 RepID=A0A7E4W8X0_PANRE